MSPSIGKSNSFSTYLSPLPPGTKFQLREKIDALEISWLVPRKFRALDFFEMGIVVFVLLVTSWRCVSSLATIIDNPAGNLTWSLANIVIGFAVAFVAFYFLRSMINRDQLHKIRLSSRDLVFERDRRSGNRLGLAFANPFSIDLTHVRQAKGSKVVFRSPRKKARAEIHVIQDRQQIWLESVMSNPDLNDVVEVNGIGEEFDRQWLCKTINDWSEGA